MPYEAKYSITIGIASRNIEKMSAAGVATAQKTVMTRMAQRQPLMMPAAEITPTKFSSTTNTGSTKAMPTTSTSFRTKSK